MVSAVSSLRGPRFAAALLASAFAVFLCWDTPFILPLKWLVVLCHELSHAIMAWLTGGRVLALNVTHREGGICLVAGGHQTLMLLAGYPGSLAWGLGALFLARSGRYIRPALIFLGALLVLVALWWVRPLLGFGFPFALVTGLLVAAAGWHGRPWLQSGILLVFGTASCAYVLIDIQQDVFSGHARISDATLLAEQTGLPFWFWGLFWYALSVLILAVAVRRLWPAH